MKLCRLILLTLFSYALISCGGAEERKAVYLEKARTSMELGDLDKARIELKNVLQIDPKDGTARHYLGKVFEQQKEYRKAFSQYLKAEELSPMLLENQARLGRFYLVLLNDKEKAQEKVDFILSNEPQNSDGLLLSASIAAKGKDENKAIVIVEDILNRDPKHIDSIMFLAILHIQEKKFSAAIDLVDTVIGDVENNEELNKLLASALMLNKDYDRAELIYKEFLNKNPDNRSSYNNLASFYNATGGFAKAEGIFYASYHNNPDDLDRLSILMKYIRTKKGDTEAIEALNKLIVKYSDQGGLRTALGELYLISGNKKSAIDTYTNAIESFSDETTGVTARTALAYVYISEKNNDKAAAIIKNALAISPNDPDVNFLNAKFSFVNKDYEKAIISLRIVTKETPENIKAFLLLAKIHEIEGNKEQLNTILNSAYDKNRANSDGLLVLAKYHLTRDAAKAEKIIDDYNAVKENNYEGLSIKAAVLNQKKQHSEAYELATILMDKFPEKANGYLQSIPYLSTIKDKETALTYLEKGYLNVQDNRKILLLLTAIQTSEEKYGVVEKRIIAEISANPNDAELKITLSKVYVIQKKFTAAEKILEDVIATNPKIEEPYINLSKVYLSSNKLEKSKNILISGEDNIPTSLKIPFMLASLYEVEESYTEAIGVYETMNKSHPDNLVVINNLASMLSDYGDNKDDLVTAKKLAEKLIGNGQPVFLDTIGWVYYKLNNSEKAVQFLKQVVEKEPEINVFNYHLGMAYRLSGDIANARIYLEKSLAGDKSFKQKKFAEDILKNL